MVLNVFACTQLMLMRESGKGSVRGRMRERMEEEVMKEESGSKKYRAGEREGSSLFVYALFSGGWLDGWGDKRGREKRESEERRGATL